VGSLEALATYWSSPPALGVLSAFGIMGLAIGIRFRVAQGALQRIRILRVAGWLIVAFWTFLAASLLLCFLLADPVEYGVATAKAVTILSIALAIGLATTVSTAIARGVPVTASVTGRSRSTAGIGPVQACASRLARRVGLARVRVRLVTGPPVAHTEPPDTLVVSDQLVGLLGEAELEAVLLHELDHLAEGDGSEKAFLGTLRRILFFDPFLRIVDRALSREREFRADQRTAERMEGGAALAAALTALVPYAGATRVAGHPRIEDRVTRLHGEGRLRT